MVLRGEMMKLEARIVNVRVQPVDDLARDIHSDIATDRTVFIQQHLDELGAATHVEHINLAKVGTLDGLCHEVEDETRRRQPLVTVLVPTALKLSRDGKSLRCHSP